MSENNEHELQQWAEQFYAKMVEEKQEEEEPSMLDQLMEKAGEYVDQKIEELPPDALVDTIDKAYTVTDKACDSIINSLDELEKWIDKW